jgi:hypothetical protein
MGMKYSVLAFEFLREYKKQVGEEPTPLMSEEMEKAIREVPRPEVI